MAVSKSKGMIEAEISEALIQFEKEYMGRGPAETRTYIIEDMIIVRLKGVLTKAEERLTKSDEGLVLIKQVRVKLLEQAKQTLDSMIYDITGFHFKSMHTDISTGTGERVIVFTFDVPLEDIFFHARSKND